jgi:sugar phosphate isomerase/epimerase
VTGGAEDVERVVSLAAGVTPELADEPAAFVDAAAAAGWPACGVWFAPGSWSRTTTGRVRRGLEQAGLIALDIEVVRLGQGDPRPLIEAGGEVGARNVLCISLLADRGETVARFSEVCELAGAAGMRACLEFMPFSTVTDAPAAAAIVADVDQPAAGVLVDTLHLVRSGGTVADIAGIDPARLPYAQWCDGAAAIEDTGPGGLVADALDGRSCPGDGELPVQEFLHAFAPDVPMSLEVRSAALRSRYPDPVERAAAVLSSCRSPRTSR